MPENAEPAENTALERIIFFSDAVIAIAMTLLVLEIRLPEIEVGIIETELTRMVVALWPKIMAFALSFWVIALYWIAHHRTFRFLRAYDRRLIYLNFLFLMFVAFTPVPISLLYEAPGRLAPVCLYAGTMFAVGASKLALWLYARRKGLIDKKVQTTEAASISRSLAVAPSVFLVSIGAAFINPTLAMYSWLILLPLTLWVRPLKPVE